MSTELRAAFRLAWAALGASLAGAALLPVEWAVRPAPHGLVLRPLGGVTAVVLGTASVLVATLLLLALRTRPRQAWAAALGTSLVAGLAAARVGLDLIGEPHLVVGPPGWLALVAFLAAAWSSLLSIGELGGGRRTTRAERSELSRARDRVEALTHPPPAWEPILGDPY